MSAAPIEFREDDLSGDPIRELIAGHLAAMSHQTPAGQVHALGVDALRDPTITLWSAWVADALAGCGALKRLDGQRGEIKSMRVTDAWLGKGVGRAILEHLLEQARKAGIRSVWLETGAPFWPARHLYERAGFRYTGPFEDYPETAFSVFMTLDLEGGTIRKINDGPAARPPARRMPREKVRSSGRGRGRRDRRPPADGIQ
jgi:putative acetyltransferase